MMAELRLSPQIKVKMLQPLFNGQRLALPRAAVTQEVLKRIAMLCNELLTDVMVLESNTSWGYTT